MADNQFDLLKTKRFLPLFIAQFLGAFNDNVFKNALVILIAYRLVENSGMNSQLLVTIAAGVFILPFFLFSAIAGQLADKYEKSRLISVIKFIEIIVMLLAVCGFYLHSIPIMIAILFLLGTQASFFGPVKYAILPVQLHEKELIAGNGLIEAGTFISILLGTIFGGVLILLPYGDIFISITLILLSSVGFISSLYIPDTNIRNPNLPVNYNFLRETFTVINYSKSRWDIHLCILGISWFWLIGAVFLAELPVFAKDILHSNEHVVTWFIAVFSIGIAFGSLLCNSLLKSRVLATFVPIGAIGITIFTADLYFAANHGSFVSSGELLKLGQFLQTLTGWRISIDLALIALCGGLFTVPLYAILQERSDPEYRARVIASNNVMNALFMVLSAIGTAIMLHIGFTITEIFLTLAVLNSFVAIYICKLLPDLLLKEILRFILTLVYRVDVIGLENFKQAGERVVIIANHSSFLDAALLAAFLPEKFTFAVDTQIAKKWWVRFFLRVVDAYPVDPTNPIAIKSLIEYVRQDKKCVIFPEGRITVTGALMKIYEGPGLIADKADAVLLPICIQGAQYSPFSRMRGKMPISFAPKITLTIFPSQKLSIPSEIKGRQRRHVIGIKLYDIMSDIVFMSCNLQKTLFSSLIEAESVHGRNYVIATDVEMKSISYHDLITRSFVLGKYVTRRTKQGENVGVILPNMIATLSVFFALQAYNRVPVILNFSSGIKNVLSACVTAEIKTVYTSRKFIDIAKLNDLVEQLHNNGVNIEYLEDIAANISLTAKVIGKFKSTFPSVFYKSTDPDSPSVILFTSGSEGSPKGVVLSHRNIQANRYQLSARIDFTETDKIFNALPLFHSFGLTGGMLLPVLSGIHVFLYPSPLHYRVIPQLIYGMNATILFGTDTFLTGYAKYAHPYDFYSLRYVFSGAEKLRPETLSTWLFKFGVRIFDGYGATETSPVLATNTPMQSRAGTVGRLLPGIDHRLSPVPGIDVGGLLSVSGANIMKGYLLANNPNVLVPPVDGWYETGDIVSIDDDGYLTIQGRVKRFAKIAGEMVSLAMVEQQLNLLWPTHQHAAVNVPDSHKGEQIILMTTNADATREEVITFFKKSQVSDLSIPKKIVIVPKLPLLGSGKIDYTKIKEMLK